MDDLKNLDKLRDCAKNCLEKGAKDKHEFRLMRYGIICELKRVGCDKKEIIEVTKDWNDRNHKKLCHRKFKQQIESFVDWIFKKEAKAGCKYFKDYCITDCKFKERKRKEDNGRLAQEVIYAEDEIKEFLKNYEKCKHPEACASVYKIIDHKRVEVGLLRNNVIYISTYEIASKLWEQGYSSATPMFACRHIRELEEIGLIDCVEKGKKGTFIGLANGYKLLTPDDVIKNDLFEFNENSLMDEVDRDTTHP